MRRLVPDSDILAAHEHHRGVRLAAAELGLSRNTLYRRLRKLGVKPYTPEQDRSALGRIGAAALHEKYGPDTWVKARQRLADSFPDEEARRAFYRRLRAIPPKSQQLARQAELLEAARGGRGTLQAIFDKMSVKVNLPDGGEPQ